MKSKDELEQIVRQGEGENPCAGLSPTDAIKVMDEIERLRAENDAWRGCVRINVKMEGPEFNGFDRCEGLRVFNKYWSDKSALEKAGK